MKLNKLILAALVGSAFTSAAHAQVDITVTGSTAFRSIAFDRIQNLFDVGSLTTVTNTANSTTAANEVTYQGTISNKVASLGGTTVKIRTSFSGSATGMNAVKNQTLVETAEVPTGTANKVADLAFSDVFPGSATPPIPEASFERNVVGIVPFVFVKNNSLAGVTNITRDQALLLMTASGDGGMPASFLGGTGSGSVYLIGRDSGSGTRITTERVVGFTGTPLLWATNSTGGYITTNGYSSGSLVRGVLNGTAGSVGYLGLGDYVAITANATSLSFNGVPYTPANVAGGSYALWGYEHVVNRVGGLSANQALVRNAILSSITDDNFQSNNTLYNVSFVRNKAMKVERGADGGVITSTEF